MLIIERSFIKILVIFKIKKPLKIKRLTRVLVLEMGLEPIRTNVHWILSPTCLPIPPLEPELLLGNKSIGMYL